MWLPMQGVMVTLEHPLGRHPSLYLGPDRPYRSTNVHRDAYSKFETYIFSKRAHKGTGTFFYEEGISISGRIYLPSFFRLPLKN